MNVGEQGTEMAHFKWKQIVFIIEFCDLMLQYYGSICLC